MLSGDDARRRWRVEGPVFAGWGVYHAKVDPRDAAIYVAANHVVYGPTLQRSTDAGRTWTRSPKIRLPEEFGLTVNALWYVEPGRADEPETLYLGGDPAVLFRSDDRGESWEPIRGILEHPTRDRWIPSRGGLCLHSIQLDPSDPQRMYVAMSSGGTFRTDDGGDTWRPINRNVAADYLPHPYPEVGQCPHKLLLHPAQPERLWQQNHCGVYRSDDRGDTWERVDENGLPSPFGFPIMIDPADPDVAVVIPDSSYEYHFSPNGRMGVYRTEDAGRTWELMSDGLSEQAWVSVLRNASAFDSDSLYFGTDSGSFFALAHGGDWVEAVRHLPPVLSIDVTQWSHW